MSQKPPKGIIVVPHPEGNHYIVSFWSGFIIKLLTGFASCVFTGAGIYIVYQIVNDYEKVKSLYSILLASLILLFPIGGLTLYMFISQIARKETWFVDGNLHHRRRLFGYTWERVIPKEKILNFDFDWAGGSEKITYYSIKVNHYAGSRVLTMKKGGYWTLTLASAVEAKAANFLENLLIKEAIPTGENLDVPPEIKNIVDTNLKLRQNFLTKGSMITGIWGIIAVFVCLITQYFPESFLGKWKEEIVPIMFILLFYPFGFTVNIMGNLGFRSIDRNSSSKEASRQYKRFYEILKTFPISTCLFLLIVINMVCTYFLPFKDMIRVLSLVTTFYALIAFVNLRIFLFGKALTGKWEKEDSTQN